MATACELSEGAKFVGKDSVVQKVISRTNFAQNRLCQIQDIINNAAFKLRQYCESEDSSSSYSSSSSSECIPECSEITPEILYMLVADDLDCDIVDALTEIERESCELIRRARVFADMTEESCIPSSSNSSSSEPPPSSSSSSEAPSSSSSSEPPSSSSSSEAPSSSSVEPPPCCRELIYLFADCEELGLNEGLFLYSIPGEEDCIYVEEDQLPVSSSSSLSSSSSSGSGSSSSGSSSSGISGYSYEYNAGLNRFELYYNGSLMAYLETDDDCSPYGVLEVLSGPCAGTFIIIE